MKHEPNMRQIAMFSNVQQLLALKRFWTRFIDQLQNPYVIINRQRSASETISSYAFSSLNSLKSKGKALMGGNNSAETEEKEPDEDVFFDPEPIPNSPKPVAAKLDDDMVREFVLLCGRHDPDLILSRFLVARKFDVDKALEMCWKCLLWRKHFQIQQIMSQGVAALPQWMFETPLAYYHKHDKEERPVIYINARYYDSKASDAEQVKRHAIFLMDTAKDYY